jgi:hypothetical protein
MQALARVAASEIARGVSTGVAVWAARTDCVCAPVLSCPLCPDCHCVGGLSRASDSPTCTVWVLTVIIALFVGFAAGRFVTPVIVGTTPVARPEAITEPHSIVEPQLILTRPRRGRRGVWGVGHGSAPSGNDGSPGRA